MARCINRSNRGSSGSLAERASSCCTTSSFTSDAVSNGRSASAVCTRVRPWASTTTATDLARFLSALDTAPGARTLLRWMRAAEPTAADGFDQQFGLFTEAAGAGVAVKQGWMCCVDRRRQLHSAGVMADGRVVVVLGDASSAVSWPALRRTVDGAAVALLTGTD